MDIFSILGYINKLSLVAFVVTLGVLLYQVYLLRKDSSQKTEAPIIPDFNDAAAAPALNYTKLDDQKIIKEAPSSNSRLIVLVVVTVGIIAVLSFSILAKNSSRSPAQQAEPIVKLVASKGIKLYDENWREFGEEEVATISAGATIRVTLDVPDLEDIDQARIRINAGTWSPEDEELEFDATRKVYYRDYVVATEASFIKAEAQLHSKVDGWLGE